MKFNKRVYIILVILVAILSSLLTFEVFYISEYRYQKSIEEVGVKSVEKIDYDLPEFTVVALGNYDTTITNEDVKDLDVYLIKAVTTDGYDNYYNEYVGIRLKDILRDRGLDEYNSITMNSNGGVSVRYDRDNIDDDVYIVFERSGIVFNSDEPVDLVSLNVYDKYFVQNLTSMNFS